MREGDQDEYAVFKYNAKTHETKRLNEVFGRSAAETKAIHFQNLLSDEEKEAGWSYYIESSKQPSVS
jgi:hypothetical protein